jgi:hypothetical protein
MSNYTIFSSLRSAILALCLGVAPLLLWSQEKEDQTLHLNGLGRAVLQNTQLTGDAAETDTTTARRITEGETLLDLKLNFTPNEKTEVQSILRLRNEFGGFFGAGMSVEVRELFAKGVIAEAIRYQVGDMDLALSPYTLFNFQEEGSVLQPQIFQAQRDILYYENFYQDSLRRFQGAKVDFSLMLGSVIEEADFQGFFTRVRGTDFFTMPSRFVTGGRVQLRNDRWGSLTGNIVHTYDDLMSGEANSGIRNRVFSVEGDFSLIKNDKYILSVTGEAGRSSLRFMENDSTTTFDESDGFLEAGVKIEFPESKLSFQARFRDVGPDFFSTGAQSKRVDFDRDKLTYNRIGNDRRLRRTTIFDLGRDRGLYTYQLNDYLMAYDPRLSNALPYGQATPNRRGIWVEGHYGDKEEALEADLKVGLLSEIRGSGTFELKNFLLTRLTAQAHIDKWLGWEKHLDFSFGLQFENTSRGGEAVEQVDLMSTLIDLGIEAELFRNFELMLGAKMLNSQGNEFLPVIEQFNTVADFPQFFANDNELLLGAGIRYTFKKGIYLTAQYQLFSFENADEPENAYQLGQGFIIYNMNF